MENSANKGSIFSHNFRYQERFDSIDQNANWNFEEEKTLFALHN